MDKHGNNLDINQPVLAYEVYDKDHNSHEPEYLHNRPEVYLVFNIDEVSIDLVPFLWVFQIVAL
jgi:hypothetical protein